MNDWLIRRLFLRAIGVGILAVGFYSALFALSNRSNPTLTWLFGGIDLIAFFTGIVMTFGRYEKTDKKGFAMGISSDEDEDVAEEFQLGFDEGYRQALEEIEEDRRNQDSPAGTQPQ